ncbi:hypothetical protein HETIRDRAFT_168785 [Heterobasidion irregulare TC 32-1]|uniref:Uncharacterized protein n=1 Tax=Heterobasidion irregulare (strain TC 32-1) TaxID=747525 RepID=W4KAA1_HETIT|nr:uncharacterized protein HETIRDRAFT_168785 [Heterobasidion irregulare TC 32-1]ETW82270.1 hypothetical protein HETIRDRAFT_168785 [Heterobasidion irregulare TC 32-1]
MNISESPEIIQDVGTVLLRDILQLVIISLFFGIYAVLVLCLIYSYSQGTIISRAKSYMFAATLLMFTGAAIIWLLSMIIVIQSIQDVLLLTDNQLLENKFPKINQETSILSVIQVIIQEVVALLGNIIIVWRAQTLWKTHYIMVFLKGTFIITTVILILNSITSSIGDERLQSWEFFSGVWIQIAQWGLELILNLVATILIAYKAWEYRQSIKAYLIKNKKTQIEIMLALLVESGIVYCGLWIFLIGSQFISIDSFTNQFDVMSLFFTGIYPTIIMIAVSLNNTVEEMSGISISKVHTSIQQELRDVENLVEAERSLKKLGKK